MKTLADTTVADTWKVWVNGECVAVCARNYDAHRIKEVWDEVPTTNHTLVTRHQTIALDPKAKEYGGVNDET